MAQRIPQEVIETVRSQTNIVEVIGQYVQLKKSGKITWGCVLFMKNVHRLFCCRRQADFSLLWLW